MSENLSPDIPDLYKSQEQLIKELVGLRANLKDATEINETEHLYRCLFNSMQEAFVLAEIILDKSGKPSDYRLLDINESYGRLTGVSPERAKGMTILELIPHLDFRWIKTCGRVALSGRPEKFEYQSTVPGKWFEGYIFSLGQGKFGHLFTDITKRKQAEEALKQSELKYRLLFNSIDDGFFLSEVLFDENSQPADILYLDGNPAALKMLGQDYRGRKLSEIYPGFNPYWVEVWGRVLRTGKGERQDHYVAPLKAWFNFYVFPVPDIGDRLVGNIFQDITERKRIEEDLHRLNETLEQQVVERTKLAECRTRQLHQLTVELIEAEEQERCRISNILHNDLQQILAGAKMQLYSAGQNLPPVPILEDVSRLLDEAISKSRRLSHELSPAVLDHSDLAAALGWLARRMNEQFGLQVQLDKDMTLQLGGSPLKIFLFRAVQELLFNVVKHAEVKSAGVLLSNCDGSIIITVSDQGRGFDPRIIDSAVLAGIGLKSLQERARYLGGKLVIESSPENGSRITLSVPLALVKTEEPQPFESVREQSGPFEKSEHIRILFADDHKVVRQGLISIVADQPGIRVVGEAANGREALELTRLLKPDVVVMDISMPEMNGVEATRIIKSELPEVRVIGLSMFDDDENIKSMLQAGVEVFLNKADSSAKLLKAIYGITGTEIMS